MIRRLAAVVGCALLFGACGTSYKVAPSTAKVATKIATAKRTVEHVREQASNLEAATTAEQAKAVTTAEHIDAALKAIDAHDYVTAAVELHDAKASNEVVQMMLQQSLRDVQSMRKSLETTEGDLGAAEHDIAELNKTIETMAIQGAKDRAIVEQGEWLFGAGYFIVGVKRILSHALWGALILGVIVIVMLCIGGPVAALALRGLRGIGSLWKNRKSG